MKNKQLVDFPDKFLVGHAALYAEIDDVQVMCTHLSTRLPFYFGAHGDEQGQQRYEINIMLDWMNERNNGGPQVMLGDFNCGPDGEKIFAEFGDNYTLFEADGYRSANIDAEGFATWAPEENKFLEDDGTPTSAIDHIFTRNAQASNSERLFDDLVTLTSTSGAPIETHFSDHFGLGATVTWTPNP